ncbi:hypothetical protein FXV83_09060 [Bradyrhizobium hipponense]|uniref:Uncharacterized protein n=1 Tax=Bradyrhizobium hipponense TaxID=2605638 RepID=A0A5S4YS22_9BRAD|nr:hypothetical protein [Bradyrhizobium hipponense]TYO66938.1 hypothetical protein FXV83_09060 [Bradyrhizobium hipponense]
MRFAPALSPARFFQQSIAHGTPLPAHANASPLSAWVSTIRMGGARPWRKRPNASFCDRRPNNRRVHSLRVPGDSSGPSHKVVDDMPMYIVVMHKLRSTASTTNNNMLCN